MIPYYNGFVKKEADGATFPGIETPDFGHFGPKVPRPKAA